MHTYSKERSRKDVLLYTKHEIITVALLAGTIFTVDITQCYNMLYVMCVHVYIMLNTFIEYSYAEHL